MFATRTTHRHAELIRWLILWGLASMVIYFFAGRLLGQQRARSIPMPNVNHPDVIRYPYNALIPDFALATLDDAIDMHRDGANKEAILAWQTIRVVEDSATWKHLGLGVAYLNIDDTDAALDHLNKSLEFDPINAVAQYFLGCVRFAQGQRASQWHDMDEKSPFRLAAFTEVADAGDESMLPRFKGSFDKQAERHFRRAIEISDKCDLDRVIRLVDGEQPIIQLASLTRETRTITARELIAALDAEHYVGKAHKELARLSIRRGDFQHAESHCDQALEDGVNASNEFIELTDA